jgi:predicted NAD/FAD-dependent oxidoreductase
MIHHDRSRTTAIVGAGLAGATLAHELRRRGQSVCVFEKSRGLGGRMATRRAEAQAADGTRVPLAFDHGAMGFTADTPAFEHWVEAQAAAGVLGRWTPRPAPRSYAPLDEARLWVAQPDMPALARALLGEMPVALQQTVTGLGREADGWRIEVDGRPLDRRFDRVVLAMPPAQAAVLLRPHRPDWATRASHWMMRPCWALMLWDDQGHGPRDWDVARPVDGPVAWIARDDSRPGRRAPAVGACWVVHATPAWSQSMLEADPADVVAALRPVVADWLGGGPWRHAVAHRWRYASAARSEASPSAPGWWDAALGLGACGDWLGGAGVEGAWTSAMSLAALMVEDQA